MKTKLKFGLTQAGQYAPKWLINTTSVIAIVIAAKHYLIDGLPILDDGIKAIVNAWTDYILDAAQVALAIAVIFFGEHTNNQLNDSTGN